MAVHKPTMAFIQQRKQAYQLTFNEANTWAVEVLKDLIRVCKANQSWFAPTEYDHAFKEGKRAVWLRIQQHLNLSEKDLYRLYGGPQVATTEEETP